MNIKKLIVLVIAILSLASCNDSLEDRSEITKFRILGVKTDSPVFKTDDFVNLTALFAIPEDKTAEVAFVIPDIKGIADEINSGEFSDKLNYVTNIVTPDKRGEALFLDEQLVFTEEIVSLFTLLGQPAFPLYVLGCSGGNIDEEMLLEVVNGLSGTSDLSGLSAACEGDDVEAIPAFKIVDIVDDEQLECELDELLNSNPLIDSFLIEEVVHPQYAQPGETGLITCVGNDGCRDPVEFQVKLDPSSYEFYCSGEKLKNELETTYISFFSDEGDFSSSRIRSDDSIEAVKAEEDGYYDSNGDPILSNSWWTSEPHTFTISWVPPLEGGDVSVWIVVHDIRGGVSWQQFNLEVVLQ